MSIGKIGKKILLSAVKPTSRPHLGNYFGAMRQFVALQDQYQGLIMIADYHALTSLADPAALRQYILDLAIDYLAIGLDPQKTVIFKQSDVPEHTELAWIFDCLTSVPYLQRAHAYKDATAKKKEANVGLLAYPLLMAADILLYHTDLVPVGQDQKQHLEMARDVAEKFNRLYGETFKLPEPLILKTVETVPGIDGRKMSKSYHNTIPLFAEAEEIKRLVMSIVTDSGQGIPRNVYAIHKLFRPEKELTELYQAKRGKYQELKETLAADINNLLAPLRKRRSEIAADPGAVKKILANGGAFARDRARLKMMEVKQKIGVDLK